MKFAALVIAALSATTFAAKDSNRRLASCLGTFESTYGGDCSIDGIKTALSSLIAGNAACSDVDTELSLLLGSPADVNAAVEELCAGAFAEQAEEFFPFSNITMKGDQHDREFLNGGTYWNEEYETNSDNLLAADAYHVPLVYDMSHSQGIGWPTNPAIASVQDCTEGAAMCCYVSDRQKNDDGGECTTDECYFAEPDDNTDICYVDMSNAPASARVANGIAVFDKSGVDTDAEGNAFCHGFAWDANDDTAASSRYKGNLLMSVAFKENTYDKGFVQNVPGAPMCGCVEKMPVVSNAACTDLSAAESWTIGSDGTTFSVSFASVDITYGDCLANDLADKAKSINPASKIDQHIVGADNCPTVIDSFLGTQGLKRSTLELVTANGHPGKEKVYLTFSKEVADSAADVSNFDIQGLTITAADMHATNKAVVILTTDTHTMDTEYIVTVTGTISKRVASMVTADIGSTATFFPVSYGYESNVPEAANYTLVYDLAIDDTVNWKANKPAYVTGTTPFNVFSRVAYFMELESDQYGHEWVWVSMPEFTQNVNKIGVPTFASGAIYQQKVPGANVFTNQADISPTGSLIDVEANLEFWPNNYATANAIGISGANGQTYDFGDERVTPGDHGSMQVHVASVGQTLFGISHWNRGKTPSLGIGNQPKGHPDWTFAYNAPIYSLKKLSVLVLAEDNVDPATLAPEGNAAALSDAAGYQIIYDLSIPDTATFEKNGVPYDRDYHLFQGAFERIGYYVELEKAGVVQWVWVSMKAFTDDASKIGVPTSASGAIFQEPVYEMNIFSSEAALTGTNLTGNVEFWPTNYATGNAAGVPGANGGVYDFGDERHGGGNYGSMQVHAPTLGQTLFAFNDFNRGASPCLGIGNQPTGHPDWTFNNNAAQYAVKKIQVFVK